MALSLATFPTIQTGPRSFSRALRVKVGPSILELNNAVAAYEPPILGTEPQTCEKPVTDNQWPMNRNAATSARVQGKTQTSLAPRGSRSWWNIDDMFTLV